jgi:hypothetical protein
VRSVDVKSEVRDNDAGSQYTYCEFAKIARYVWLLFFDTGYANHFYGVCNELPEDNLGNTSKNTDSRKQTEQ